MILISWQKDWWWALVIGYGAIMLLLHWYYTSERGGGKDYDKAVGIVRKGRRQVTGKPAGPVMTVTTTLVIRYMERHYQVTRDQIRVIRPLTDGSHYAVETLDGRAYTVSMDAIAVDEGIV